MAETTGDTRRRILFFRAQDAEELGSEMMPVEGMDEGAAGGLASLSEGNFAAGLGDRARVLFREPGEKGMSLVYLWFKSGYVLPFHSHNVDCLYYVLGGELHMGSQVLRKGDGFFIPADHGYGYEAGPDGVEVLEFRHATRFNFVFKGNSEARWDRILEVFRQRADLWAEETVPPSER